MHTDTTNLTVFPVGPLRKDGRRAYDNAGSGGNAGLIKAQYNRTLADLTETVLELMDSGELEAHALENGTDVDAYLDTVLETLPLLAWEDTVARLHVLENEASFSN